ncbi:MAG: molybdopterin molybdotransferase MoeA [Spirochaetales bacterium]|uniref:Molybdopterin molybdenumtransferase n=1 Tax=Candidatus Thalassospirochaeta sargassi TaxID=3119039 RepID=A0AAJ1ML49_9SPIO|nr:molybdopterin molybdotransferase MoeA [Spirochaetales bacterium]
MELLNVITIEDLKALLAENFSSYRLDTETIDVSVASGRFLACDTASAELVPPFRRSTMDGYALRSADISGASDSLPAFLMLRDEVKMGHPADTAVGPGDAVYVPTGGMVPDGADAVVMIEYTEKLTDNEVAIYRPAAAREHVISVGDDIKKGELILKKGRKLTAADLGVLTSIGLTRVEVYRKLAVSVISTGDEIAGPDDDIRLGQVRDINTYTIAAAAEELGCRVVHRQVVGDDAQLLRETLVQCREESDIVMLSGGSSVGVKDYSQQVIASLGEPGILCHGIAFKPGKPTIVANSGGKPVIGLPGHPVSAMLVFSIIGSYLVRLMNCSEQPIESWVEAFLTENVNGAPGREAWQMVNLRRNGEAYEAVPVHGESGLISLLASASGSVRIPVNTEGYSKGTAVRVYPL